MVDLVQCPACEGAGFETVSLYDPSVFLPRVVGEKTYPCIECNGGKLVTAARARWMNNGQ